jgi:hypothetical protein
MREKLAVELPAQPEADRRVPPPSIRPLKVYAFDPSRAHLLNNEMTLNVPYERLERGPRGRRVTVVDYDSTHDCFYPEVDLEDPHVVIRSGLAPSESNPYFHQQMVYAVAMETLYQFEAALGRRVHWRRWDRAGRRGGRRGGLRGRRTLKLYPHAMAEQNAFYSREAQGILFGYFPASQADPGKNLPGETVFTCLSHDIIAHELTHAVVDTIRGHFMEPTNLDVLAFHEAFADLVALFRHFSHRTVLLDTVQKTGGRLFDAFLEPAVRTAAGATAGPVVEEEIPQGNPLIELARQFGDASGRNAALRSALGTPATPLDYSRATEPHARGAVLVAAVFAAYFSTYLRRSANVFRLYRAGGGDPAREDLPAPMAELLATEASRTADQFFRLCVRALDYTPPVDITFGDFLRGVVTAHTDLQPVDDDGVRDAFMQAFRRRGIYPTGAQFLSEDALCWPADLGEHLPGIDGLAFGDPSGLITSEQDADGDILRAYARRNAKALGLDPSRGIEAQSFHPMFRVGVDGRLRTDMAIVLLQKREVQASALAQEQGAFPLRGGVTLIVSKPLPDVEGEAETASIRHVIPKQLCGDQGERREARQRAHHLRTGVLERGRPEGAPIHIDFALVHRGM